MRRAKLGLASWDAEADTELWPGLTSLLAKSGVDYTLFWRQVLWPTPRPARPALVPPPLPWPRPAGPRARAHPAALRARPRSPSPEHAIFAAPCHVRGLPPGGSAACGDTLRGSYARRRGWRRLRGRHRHWRAVVRACGGAGLAQCGGAVVDVPGAVLVRCFSSSLTHPPVPSSPAHPVAAHRVQRRAPHL